MVNKISLTCPSCGGRLSVTPDIDRFACAHWGNEFQWNLQEVPQMHPIYFLLMTVPCQTL